MTAQELTLKKTLDWRTLLFRIVAGLISLFFLAISVYALLWPWVIVLPDMPDPELQRWFAAQWGVLGSLFFALPLVISILKPNQSKNLMQYWFFGNILVSLFWFLVGEKTIDSFVIILLILLTYPHLRDLFKFEKPLFNRRFAALGAIVVLGFLPRMILDFKNTFALIGGSTEDLMMMDNFTHELNIFLYIILGVTAVAFKLPNWKTLAYIVGVAMTYLGIVAFFIPGHPGSWGWIGGALALLWGVVYLGAIQLELKKS